MDADSSPPPANVRAFCRQILENGDLASKLAAPLGRGGTPLCDDAPGPPLFIDAPARGPGLSLRGGAGKLPRPGQLRQVEARILCLSRFAHHELMAVELFAWALLRWPDLPPLLRRGLLAALVDEQNHCRLYLDRMAAQGGDFMTDDHSDYFWRQAPVIAASPEGPRAFLSAMGLTLEQANLDFTLTYRDGFKEAGDLESAAVCQQVHDEEIAHVALAARWLDRLSTPPRPPAPDPAPDDNAASDARDTGGAGAISSARDLELYLATVPFPMGPARAKGKRFERGPRQRAGLSEALIEHVRLARSNAETQTVPKGGTVRSSGPRRLR